MTAVQLETRLAWVEKLIHAAGPKDMPALTRLYQTLLGRLVMLDVEGRADEGPPAVNAGWAARGKACRDRRVNGGDYRTQREQAAAFGMHVVALSKMENGKLDPAPLERAWAEKGVT